MTDLSDAALREMAQEAAPNVSVVADSSNTDDLPSYLFGLLCAVRDAQRERDAGIAEVGWDLPETRFYAEKIAAAIRAAGGG